MTVTDLLGANTLVNMPLNSVVTHDYAVSWTWTKTPRKVVLQSLIKRGCLFF